MFNWFKKPKKKQVEIVLDEFIDDLLSGDQQKSIDSYKKYVSLKMNEIVNRNNPFWH